MDDWIYWCAGMHIQHTIADRATNGFVGVTRSGQLVLFNNECQEFNRGWIYGIECRGGTSMLTTDWVKLNGTKYTLVFRPLSQSMALGLGGLLGGAIAATVRNDQDPRTEKEKRSQFWTLINQIRYSRPPWA